jgi:hypothetical protein
MFYIKLVTEVNKNIRGKTDIGYVASPGVAADFHEKNTAAM